MLVPNSHGLEALNRAATDLGNGFVAVPVLAGPGDYHANVSGCGGHLAQIGQTDRGATGLGLSCGRWTHWSQQLPHVLFRPAQQKQLTVWWIQVYLESSASCVLE